MVMWGEFLMVFFWSQWLVLDGTLLDMYKCMVKTYNLFNYLANACYCRPLCLCFQLTCMTGNVAKPIRFSDPQKPENRLYTVYNDTTYLILHVDLCTPIQ